MHNRLFNLNSCSYIADDAVCELVSKTVKDFILSVGARTPAPGGGSVSATVGALVSIYKTEIVQV